MNVFAYYPAHKLSNHDSCVAIARDGRLDYAFEEQKLSRVNHREPKFFPDRTTLSAFYTTGLDPAQVDVMAVVGPEKIDDPANVIGFVEKYFGIRAAKVVACPHHVAHSALAVYGSGLADGVYWTLDAGGEDGICAEFGVVEGRRMRRLHTVPGPTLGTFYHAISGTCGFADFEEGKVMGLASYGTVDSRLYDGLRQMFSFDAAGHVVFASDVRHRYPTIRWDKFDHDEVKPYKVVQYVQRLMSPTLDRLTRGHLPETIAATAQRLCEDLALETLTRLLAHFGLVGRPLMLSGGLFQNIIINKRIREVFGIDPFVPPGVGDMGLAAGAALWASAEAGVAMPSEPVSAYLGPRFDDAEVEALLARFSVEYARLDADGVAAGAAAAIADGKVVGWFQGRAEFGARALGARSVLADPRDPDAKARVNQLLKKRDWFMPYAPSVLAEHADRYLGRPCPSPYMTMAFECTESAPGAVPSAVHVDGTVRPHIVEREHNPLYHRMISDFHRLTGEGMVLNTSFNRHGTPIVATPRHAIEHLLEGVVDVLFIGSFRAVCPWRRRPAHEELVPEPVLRALMGVRQGLDFLDLGDAEAARTAFGRCGYDVLVRDDDAGRKVVIAGHAYDRDAIRWNAVAADLARHSPR